MGTNYEMGIKSAWAVYAVIKYEAWMSQLDLELAIASLDASICFLTAAEAAGEGVDADAIADTTACRAGLAALVRPALTGQQAAETDIPSSSFKGLLPLLYWL